MCTITRPRPAARSTILGILSVCAALAACQRSQAVPVASRTGPGLITGPAAAAPAAAESSAYYVASERGIRILDAATLDEGRPPRMISMTPARRPRLIADARRGGNGHVLVFLAPAQAGTEIRRLDASTGDERVLATLPRGLGAECGLDAESQVAELIHADDDFTVLPDGSAACLTVQDRNDSTMSVAIAVRVDLGSGRFEQVALASKTCPVTQQLPPAMTCQNAGQNRPAAATPAPLPAPEVAGLVPELVSSSGRWLLYSGGIRESNHMRYRKLVLQDRSQGRFYPLHEGNWPDPVPVEALAGLLASGDDTLAVTGDDSILALEGDRILAGSLLVIPGKRILDIEGELAR